MGGLSDETEKTETQQVWHDKDKILKIRRI
jgi:hypothetical protein